MMMMLILNDGCSDNGDGMVDGKNDEVARFSLDR